MKELDQVRISFYYYHLFFPLLGISMFFFCWISIQNNTLSTFATTSLFLYYAPHFLLWIFSLVVNLVAFCILFGKFPASSETRRHIIKQNTLYVLLLGIETILIIPFWIAQLSISSSYRDSSHLCFLDNGSLTLAYLFAIVHSSRGVVDLLVWWVTFSIGPKDFRNLFVRYKAWRYSYLYLPQDNLHTPLVGVEQSKLNTILRKDVIFCINYGILDAVKLNSEEENQRTHLGSVRDPFMAQVMLKWDEEVYEQETIRKHSDPKYQEVHKRRIPFHPSNTLKDFAFIDIEPTVFGLLRHSYGVDSLLYQQSFHIRDDQDVESSGMLEKFTEGKSGSFFYFTRDFKYIIKTVTSEEEAFLQKIAFRYYKHMQNNPDSVIVRLFGLHKVRLAREQQYISVVVMENLFHNGEYLKMNERYDLKGSRIGRRVLKGNEKREDRYKKTLKDLDLQKPVVIGPEAKAQLMEQLQRDIEFLSSLHIMDYSLLLGIHHHSPDEEHGNLQHSIAVDFGGGDDFTQVTFGERSDDIPLLSSLSSSPRSTLERGAAIANRPRRPTLESVYDDDIEDSINEGARPRTRHVPWYRRDFGGLRSFSPRHPLNADQATSHGSIVLPDEEPYQGLNMENLPTDTYFFGIVDILQVYNLDKKMENFTKTKLLCKDKDGISAVHEKRYGERFLEAMDRVFV